MKKLIESANKAKASNGGSYAVGYMVRVLSPDWCEVIIDRAYGSDFDGCEHSWYLQGTKESVEKLVEANASAFASMVSNASGVSFSELPYEIKEIVWALD